VAQRQHRVLPDHPGTGEPHDFFHRRPFFRTVAMNRAIHTGWFLFTERASFEAGFRIVDEVPTVRTDRFGWTMVSAAIALDHGGDRLMLSSQAF